MKGDFRFRIEFNLLPEVAAKLPGAAEWLVKATALVVQSNAIVNLSTGEKSGRVYRRGGKTHVASAPGEAPAKDTGFLAASVEMEMMKFLGSGLDVQVTQMAAAEVRVDAEYGLPLEFGNEHLGGPRPFFGPAVEVGWEFVLEAAKKLEERLHSGGAGRVWEQASGGGTTLQLGSGDRR